MKKTLATGLISLAGMLAFSNSLAFSALNLNDNNHVQLEQVLLCQTWQNDCGNWNNGSMYIEEALILEYVKKYSSSNNQKEAVPFVISPIMYNNYSNKYEKMNYVRFKLQNDNNQIYMVQSEGCQLIWKNNEKYPKGNSSCCIPNIASPYKTFGPNGVNAC